LSPWRIPNFHLIGHWWGLPKTFLQGSNPKLGIKLRHGLGLFGQTSQFSPKRPPGGILTPLFVQLDYFWGLSPNLEELENGVGTPLGSPRKRLFFATYLIGGGKFLRNL